MSTMISLPDAVTEIIKDKLEPSVWDKYVPIIKTGEKQYSVFLLSPIEEPCMYGELIHLLNTADNQYIIELFISTPGGDGYTGEMVYRALKNSSATTIANCSGLVASAGTIITMGCTIKEVSPTTTFMVHESSFENLRGKASDLERFQKFHSKHLKEFFGEVYGDLLSAKELKTALLGEELWFIGSEVTERLSKNKVVNVDGIA